MQFATPKGLTSAVGTRNERHHIIPIQNAAEQPELHKQMLTQNWASKTPQQAFDFLSKPDVTVTNESDKEGQLPKIKKLNETVQGSFTAVERQLQQMVTATAAEAKRARAALEAFERENGVMVGEGDPTKVAVVQAERVAVVWPRGEG